MTASERSYLGLAKQTAKGTPNTTDGAFKYLLFTQGGVSPNNNVIPLDPEIGGGAMQRDVVRVGVTSAGAMSFIPRPETLGLMLLGALGSDTAALVPTATAAYKHTFKLPTDQFSAPYFTLRSSPGGMWWEQAQDMRVASLALSFRAADFLRGEVGFMGGLPAKMATDPVGAITPDGGPQFIAPVSDIELPTATEVKVLGGSFTAGLSIPLDEQWIVGSYTPDSFDISQRAFAISLTLKITDGSLYQKVMYDPASGNNWTADMLREGDFKLELKSTQMVEAAIPYSLTIKANNTADNVVWSAQPIGLRAGRQVIMNVTGMFLAADTDPVTVELVNDVATAY